MKPKKVSKKLNLRKETVTNLDIKKMDAIQGGIRTTSWHLGSLCATECQTDCGICPTDENWPTCCGSDIVCTCL